MISIDALSNGEEPAWDDFLLGRSEATLYHTTRYRNLLSGITKAHAEYLVAKRSGRIAGVLPLMALDGPFGTVLNSLPFFGSYGGVIAEDALATNELWSAFAERRDRPGTASVTVIENPFGGGLPPHTEASLEDRRISQITHLPAGSDVEQELLRRIDGSARRNIRKAEQSGVKVSIENGALDFLASTHRANMAEIGGTAKPDSFFEAFARVFVPEADYRIYVARIDGEAVAALLLLYYKHFVEYFVPVTTSDSREAQPMAAILAASMTDASRAGYTLWNWGGTWTTQEGVYRFKRKWAAQESGYHYFTYVKNNVLLRQPAKDLRAGYPWFFVAPYGSLTSVATSK